MLKQLHCVSVLLQHRLHSGYSILLVFKHMPQAIHFLKPTLCAVI